MRRSAASASAREMGQAAALGTLDIVPAARIARRAPRAAKPTRLTRSEMQPLDSSLDLDAFWRTVASAPRRALLLDFDGTLAPFSVDRLRPQMREGAADALDRIARTGRTRLAIVTGRGARELASLLPPGLRAEVWGSH